MYLLPERENGVECHLEVLESPWDTYDGDAIEQAEYKVKDGYLPPPQQYPYQVHHYRHAARFAGTVHKLMAERPKGISAQFEQLHAERNADDGYTHDKSHDIIYHGDDKASENQPEDVS